MPRKKKCPWKDKCQNGGEGCYTREPETCVRFMPTEGTNLTNIDGVVETPPGIDYDKFSQYFINWIESMGWSFCGSLKKYEETEDNNIHCVDCKHLEFSDCYAECSKGYKGIVRPHDSCGKGEPRDEKE